MNLRKYPITAILGLAIAGAAVAQEATPAASPAETTPVSLPGAEAHVYRALEPDPLRLFVAKPKGWTADDKRPGFVFFFGGGWTKGTPEKSVGWARWAATMGMVGVAPDYRTKNRFGTSPLESVADGRAALHWVQEHAGELGIDPARIVVGGSSAGGHVALWTAIEKTPPGSDPAEAPKIKPAALILSSAVTDTSPATGYTPTRFRENAEALSPVHQMDKTMPPTLMFHGDADQLVNYSTAVALRDKMVENGNECELITVPGGSHGFSTDLPEWKTKVREMIKPFLEKQKLVPTAGE